MQTNKNLLYYLLSIGIFLLLKLGYTFADNNSLFFLLKPTDKLVSFLTGSSSVYLVSNGYYNDKLNILIDKSCSGFNFWILCFLVFTYLTIKYLDKPIHKILSIPAALFSAYCVTIFVNTSRIYASIIVQHQTKNILLNYQPLIHEAVGIITNLSFLILAFYLLEKFLTNKLHHEKLA